MKLDSGDGLIRLDSRTPVRFVGLCSLLGVAYVLFNILWPLRWSLLALWVAVELMFFIFCWRPRYAELNKQPVPHKPKAVKAMKHFQRCLQYFRETPDLDIEMYYSGWFCGAKIDDIKRGVLSSQLIGHAHYWYKYCCTDSRNRPDSHQHKKQPMSLSSCLTVPCNCPELQETVRSSWPTPFGTLLCELQGGRNRVWVPCNMYTVYLAAAPAIRHTIWHTIQVCSNPTLFLLQ